MTSELAYAQPCPLCGAAPGQPCRYVLTDNLAGKYISSPQVKALRDRVGMPTERPHNARYTAAKNARIAQDTYYKMQDWLRENWEIFTWPR